MSPCKKYLLAFLCLISLSICHAQNRTPLALQKVAFKDFKTSIDSICNANNVKIFIEPRPYKTFGISRLELSKYLKHVGNVCKDTSVVYSITMFAYDYPYLKNNGKNSTLKDVITKYKETEKQRNKKQYRVSWEEYRKNITDTNSPWRESKGVWEKRRMLRSEMNMEIEDLKKFATINTISNVASPDETLSTKPSNTTMHKANGMIGVTSDKVYIGKSFFGASDYKLNDNETLNFAVTFDFNNKNNPRIPEYKISDNANITVINDKGQKETHYITMMYPKLTVTQGFPLKYYFTSIFKYNDN